MRIRRSTTTTSPSSVSHCPPSPTSPSSCSSSSSCFSSSTHSTISTHARSPSSSSNSTTSSSSLVPSCQRCQGLDLLVKAVYHVAGSVVGVPYIQRRVIRRRKPALSFTSFVIKRDIDDDCVDEDEQGQVLDGSLDELKKQRRRSMGLPSKFNDSVLQSLKPKRRRRRRSSHV